MFLQCFPPPLNIATGFDLRSMAAHCNVIGIKFYTMHWPMIEANYLRWLAKRTDFAPEDIVRALSAILRLSPGTPRCVEGIRYPEPDESHPCANEDLHEKLRSARHQLPEDTLLVGIAHAYGPVGDFTRRLRATVDGADGRTHINRFAYMSDEKLAAVARLARKPGTSLWP